MILRNSEKRSLENDLRTRIPSVDFPLENQGSRAVSYLCHISHYAWLRSRISPIGHGDPRDGRADYTPQARDGSQGLSPERAEFGKLDAATNDLVPGDV